MIAFRRAAFEDIGPAFDLALRVFMEYEAPISEAEAIERLQADFASKKARSDIWITGGRLMFVALDCGTVVGMADARENGHIQSFYVDGAYHRRGIGTELLSRMVCELKLRGLNEITLDSSPYALPFYQNFGFTPTDVEQRKEGFICIPLVYRPGEIWDILDEHGNKTGRYAERGRKMATGDYHLVVHVWKRNNRGEWLIDKRAPSRGTSIDGKWETTGGAALAGEDSLTAALRETREELGIELDPQKGTLFNTIDRHGNDGHTWIQDTWVFEWNGSIEDVRFQESETCDVMWARTDKIREMMGSGAFLSAWFYPYFDEMVEKWKAAR
jgi:8-oxo-dGTP pyrophosphatase MutT (NUDIX family)/GNAT superfamily N-acetyltransferase